MGRDGLGAGVAVQLPPLRQPEARREQEGPAPAQVRNEGSQHRQSAVLGGGRRRHGHAPLQTVGRRHDADRLRPAHGATLGLGRGPHRVRRVPAQVLPGAAQSQRQVPYFSLSLSLSFSSESVAKCSSHESNTRRWGHTPIDEARRFGHTPVVEMLQTYIDKELEEQQQQQRQNEQRQEEEQESGSKDETEDTKN